MKKLYWASGAFFAGTLFQLICVIGFLFMGNDPITNSTVLAVLLFLSGAAVITLDFMLKRMVQDGALDDSLLGLAASLKRLISTLLGLEIANMLIWAISAIFELPFWAYVSIALTFVLACIISVILLLVSLKRGRSAEVEE